MGKLRIVEYVTMWILQQLLDMSDFEVKDCEYGLKCIESRSNDIIIIIHSVGDALHAGVTIKSRARSRTYPISYNLKTKQLYIPFPQKVEPNDELTDRWGDRVKVQDIVEKLEEVLGRVVFS